MTPDAVLSRRCKGIRRASLLSFGPGHRTRQWTKAFPFGVIHATNPLMSKNHMHLRPLTHEDALEFQRLRLQGLQDSPSSFGSSHEEEVHKTPDQVRQHIASSVERVFLGLFAGAELVGMVGVGREQGLKERHIAFIRSMYVAPGTRGQGAGRQLLDAALQQARAWHGVEQVTLSVTASNEAALRLYQAAGFMEVGRMPRALKVGPSYFDELMMVRNT